MPWKLGSADDPTVKVEMRMPKSMRDWLLKRRGGLSVYVRRLVAAKMNHRKFQDPEEEQEAKWLTE